MIKLSLRRNVSSKVDKKERVTTSLNTCTVPVAQTSGVNLTIQQAKNIAVTEVQQDGCTGNFKIIDSQYGNFLVPVVPTLSELAG
ncbi:hypothetical protein RGQ29_011090 [Quercus rubra]|uniref:Uncharacterized protein n=1 Tax=Quercus rubra TaxID=3512 RepID=A0AAN7FWU9_QUERU|nr:hypothetical protein RGQ29_011090 [Quercus rubra]